MAEEKDTAAPAKRTAGKTGRRKKPEAEHAARAAPQDKDTGSKAQELLEQARTEPKPEWEVAEQVVLLPLDRLRPFKNHPFKVNDEDELMQDTIDSIMAGGVINPILVRPAEDGKFEVVSGHRRFRASELAGKADIKAIVREMDDDTAGRRQRPAGTAVYPSDGADSAAAGYGGQKRACLQSGSRAVLPETP